jgi:hypothetical protein
MEPLKLGRTSVDENTVLVQGLNFAQIDSSEKIHTEYLVAEFDKSFCPTSNLSAIFKYKKDYYEFADFSANISIALAASSEASNTSTRVYFPVFYTGYSRFAGIEISKDNVDCVTALYRVKELKKIPMLLNLTFPPNWDQLPRYQTLKNWERKNNEHIIPIIKSVEPYG